MTLFFHLGQCEKFLRYVKLATSSKDKTIENILAKDDFDLGLAFLMGKHKLDEAGAQEG